MSSSVRVNLTFKQIHELQWGLHIAKRLVRVSIRHLVHFELATRLALLLAGALGQKFPSYHSKD